jgi:hypothetical protein
MWQLQYLRALEIGAAFMAEADRERLVRAATRARSEKTIGPTRRVIASGARSVERMATTVATWADPRAA